MNSGWYPVFLREMHVFRRRFFRFRYVLATMMTPVIYFVVFGLGLGPKVKLNGKAYSHFLLPGLAAMSSMTNAYVWVANALNISRLFHKSFQIVYLSPISAIDIVIGHVLSGMVRGLTACLLVVGVGLFTPGSVPLTSTFAVGIILNSFVFAALGCAVGMKTQSHEDTSMYTNYLIVPMSFFSGTFFPVGGLPAVLQRVLALSPLTHTSILVRKTSWDAGAFWAVGVLCLFGMAFCVWAIRLVKNYNE